MIVGDSEKLKEELIQNALIAARADWEKIKREQGLTNIPNPHPNGEKGINFDFKVEEITVAAQISERMAEEDLDESAHHEKVEGVTPSAHSAYQGAAPGIFKGQTEKRRETFMAKGRALNLTDDQVEQLYRITGRSEKEALTGFDQASDRPGTLLSAMELYKTQWPWVYAGYVEVDVKNLGGLNKNLPRGDANNVFKFMSDTTDQHVRSLKADVASFRHGGDEFSFIVVAKAIQIDKGILSRLLAKAQNEIDAYVKTAKYVQKKKQDITIDSVEEADITTLNQGRLPQKLLEASFKETQIQRIGTIVENENWMVVGKDTDWAILRQGTTLKTTHLPRELTLSEIPHSKSTPDKPRKPGTGIVWAVSNVQLSDNSPIDVVARADQEVESKKMQEK